MVFEEIIRRSPRRRASPCIAEGFSPTARGAYRIKCSISIISVIAWDALFSGAFNLVYQVQPL